MTNHTKVTIFVVAALIIAGFYFSPTEIPKTPIKSQVDNPPKPVQKKKNLLTDLAQLNLKKTMPAESKKSAKSVPVSAEVINSMYRMISSSNRMSRFNAARFLAQHGDEGAIPYLIRALSDDSTAMGVTDNQEPGATTVRYWANRGLVRITGYDPGFAWDDLPELREKTILQWRTWYMQKHAKTTPPATQKSHASILTDIIGRFGN